MHRNFNDSLQTMFEAEIKGKKIKKIDISENCSALGYFSGGSGVAVVTLKTGYSEGDLISDNNGKVYSIKKVNKYSNLVDIPEDISLSEEKTSNLIQENMKAGRVGYNVLILEMK
jgi:hypothetical protein